MHLYILFYCRKCCRSTFFYKTIHLKYNLIKISQKFRKLYTGICIPPVMGGWGGEYSNKTQAHMLALLIKLIAV